jgi:signal transduction histidine kinase/DNA-binding response OmpR family regulator
MPSLIQASSVIGTWRRWTRFLINTKPSLAASLNFTSFFGFAMIALVWLGVVHNLSIRREAVTTSAEQNVANLSRFFEEHVSRAISEANKRLLLLRSAYESAPEGDFDLLAWVGNAQFKLDLDAQYALIGADGMMIASNVGPTNARIDLSDREHFRIHVDATNDELFISKPVLGRASGKWSIQLTRRITDRNGRFAGVLVSSLSTDHLAKLYESIDLGRDGAITLVGFDGIIRARGGANAGALGRSMLESKVFDLYRNKESGVIMGTGAIDGVQRLLGYRVVRNFPLIVIAAVSEREIYDDFERERQLYLLAALVLTVIILTFIVAGVRNRARLYTTLADLAAERDVAQQANRAKSTFLAMMSHEIRTPMNAMLGLTSTLLEDDLPSEHRKSLKTIQEAGDNLLEILNDILNYSKLEAGQLALEEIPFAPDEVSASAVSVIGPRAEAKGLALLTSSDPNLPEGLLGDASRLRQVLLNLISNAVKFTSAGIVRVECNCISKSESKATLEWVVSDTGIGISPAQIKNLFKDYAQADISINRRFGGSGLGLSICRRIVDRMGGSIDVKSVVGQGTTFRCRVELPITTISHEPVPQEECGAQLRSQISSLGRQFRLLIVDDNPTNRLVAAKMLDQFHLRVSMAADGAEAVALATETNFDAILMDMQMPEMDGISASRALRARGSTVPIVAFTANAYEDDQRACRDAGMDEFVAKPVRKHQLVSAIERAISRSMRPVERSSSEANIIASEGKAAHSIMFERGTYNELADALGPEGMQEALDSFFRETELRLLSLRMLRRTGDREVIKREAHTMKGAAATFGFSQLSELAKWLEQNAEDVPRKDLDSLVNRMESAFIFGRNAITPPSVLAS